jgi:hypothetical protein
MTIKDLKAFIADMPDDMLVLLPEEWVGPYGFRAIVVHKGYSYLPRSYAVREGATVPALILCESDY